MSDTMLTLSHLAKHFGRNTVIEDLSLEVQEGQYVTFLGPSGSGKTTTIRMIAGHELPDAGTIEVAGKDITYLAPQRRPVGMMFQNYALFPHLSVRKNIGFGLRQRRAGKRETTARVDELLELMQLTPAADKRPHQLSGGMQQRVALARALAVRPRILLMDEPFSALDAQLRRSLRAEVLKIHREAGVTTIHVTHDQEEALSMSDLVVVMNEGRVARSGSPDVIYEDPQVPFVADFLGRTNMLACAAAASPSPTLNAYAVGSGVVHAPSENAPADASLISVRPERVEIALSASALPSGLDGFVAEGRVEGALFMGGWSQLTVRVDSLDADVSVQAGPGYRYEVGERVAIGWRAQDVVPLAAKN